MVCKMQTICHFTSSIKSLLEKCLCNYYASLTEKKKNHTKVSLEDLLL